MTRTILSMLDHAAEQFHGTPYCWKKTDTGWQSRTFEQVREESMAVGAALIGRGIGMGDRVAILAEGSPEWVAVEFATIQAGGISVPLSIKLLAEEVPFRINHAGAKVIATTSNQAAKIAQVYGQFETQPLVIVLDNLHERAKVAFVEAGSDAAELITYVDLLAEGRALMPSAELQERRAAVGEDSVATISYTSGTTGDPKGIMLTNLNYYANCTDSVQMFEVPFGYSTLLILPCDHSFAHTVGIYAALLRGIQLFFVDSRGGGMAILRNIPHNMVETAPVFLLTVPALTGNFMKKITSAIDQKGGLIRKLFWAGVNAGIRRNGDGYRRPGFGTQVVTWVPWALANVLIFRKVRKTFGSRIKFFVGGGALLDSAQQEFFMAIGLPVYQGYGLTEAAPVISSNTPRVHKIGSSGQIAPSVTCTILDENGVEQAVGVQGEICITGENVMAGYYRNESATEKALSGNRLHTGDLGYLDADGFLMVTGRFKALLISSDGEKYSPEGIEEAITTASAEIAQVMVYNDHRKYTSALVTLDIPATQALIKEEQISTAGELIAALKDCLAAYTASGKSFPAQWTPATFAVLREPFSEANKMINSTMKMVRHRITEHYAETLEYLYTDDGHNPDNERNRIVVKELFNLGG